jgi:DNA gyrase subunit A
MAKGTAIVNLLSLQGDEKVTAMFPVTRETEGEYLVMATRDGVIKKTPVSEFDNIRKGGIIAQSLREGDELISVLLSTGSDEIFIGTRKGLCIRFNEDDVRPMGRTASGVRSIDLADDDSVVDMEKVIPGADVLTISENGMGKRTPEEAYRTQRRAGKGIIAMSVTDKTGDLACMKMCGGDEDIMLIRDDGNVIRMPVEQISRISRATQGVRLMRVDEGTRVVGVALVEHICENENQ